MRFSKDRRVGCGDDGLVVLRVSSLLLRWHWLMGCVLELSDWNRGLHSRLWLVEGVKWPPSQGRREGVLTSTNCGPRCTFADEQRKNRCGAEDEPPTFGLGLGNTVHTETNGAN